MVEALMNAIMLGAPLAADAIQTIRLKALVGDAELLGEAAPRCPTRPSSNRCSGRLKNPEELHSLLKITPDVAKLEEMLTARQQFRERFAQRWEKDHEGDREAKGREP